MNVSTRYPVALVSTFLWIGFVCAISFMEAWLKFRAPGITLALGLGIGRLVFGALNKIEWVFAIAIIINFILVRNNRISDIIVVLPFLILLLQTFWLLPALDARAEMHIQGLTVQPSYIHFYNVAMEVIKVLCLAIFGIKLFKS